jgi:transcriptional regulator with XRE-family HTH domain
VCKYVQIGSRVKEVRKSLGLTQREFAKRIYLDQNITEKKLECAISKVERGHYLPPTRLLVALDNVHVSTDYVLFGEVCPSIRRLCNLPIYKTSTLARAFFAKCADVVDRTEPDLLLDDDANSSECGQRLRYIRKTRGFRQGDFGCDKSCVSRNECTDDFIDVSYLVHFCRKFEVSSDFILFGTYPSLPSELSEMLYDYSYETQQRLLATFCEIADNIFGLR